MNPVINFDQNFSFPIPPSLESRRLELIPWDPSLHSEVYYRHTLPHPKLFNYLPFGPFHTKESFDEWFEQAIHSKPTSVAFAIFDKTDICDQSIRRGEDSQENGKNKVVGFAGMIGLLNASPQHLSAEIGYITILPSYHRTHVSTNAVGLLLQWLLNTPNVSNGLGLRRVYWSANTLNTRSIALAQRLGLRLEATLRWDRVLPIDRHHFSRKEERRKGDPMMDYPGRDTAHLAICWDEWEEGGREKVENAMERVLVG